MRSIMIVKAHAFGNDFVLVESRAVQGTPDLPALAQAICARHRGIGADGLIVYSTTPKGASMRLLNADGSRSEVSGNGVRCLGAWIASQRGVPMPGQQAPIEIQTDAGVKRLELLVVQGRPLHVPCGHGCARAGHKNYARCERDPDRGRDPRVSGTRSAWSLAR